MADSLPPLLEIVCSLLMVAGGVFALLGALGLVRLRDLMQRLHAPTKASTLGVGGVLAASMVYSLGSGTGWAVHEPLIAVLVFLTAPVAAHALATAAGPGSDPGEPTPGADTPGLDPGAAACPPPADRPFDETDRPS